MLRRTLPLAGLLLAALLGPAAQALPLDSRTLDQVPIHAIDVAAVERARAALPPASPRQPPMLALNLDLPLGLTDGAWTEQGDESVWRLRLYSAGATLLTAAFDQFELPAGASLSFSDTAGTLVQGPYTAAQRNAAGGLSTALVPGQEALLELRVPTAGRDAVRLHLARLGHGLLPLGKDGVPQKSGTCNNDVICPVGNAWRNQIRSVVLLQFPDGLGTFVCSGQFINNSAQDGTPYLLTAHHCDITTVNDQDVVVYFNYQTSSCGGAPNGSMSQSLTGTSFVFTDASADHTLLRTTQTPPGAYGVYLTGFNASTTAEPSSGVGIHHPGGDEKRISVFSAAPSRGPINLEGQTVQAFSLRWSDGVTEGGSSGSGLWNQNRELVGVLSGGASSCLNANGVDSYGRLDVAWGNGLSTFLDPVGSGRSLCGTNLGSSCTTSGSGGGGSGTPTPSTGGSGGTGGGGGGGGGGAFGGGLILLLAGLLRRRVRRA